MPRKKQLQDMEEVHPNDLPVSPAVMALAELWQDQGMVGVGVSNTFGPPPDDPIPRGFIGTLLINQDHYCSFLGLVQSGASVRDAAAAIGLIPNWIEKAVCKGREELEEGRDTWLGRLVLDVMRAKGQARSSAQIKVKQRDTLAWLRNDADGRGWSESAMPTPQIEDHVDMVNDDQEMAPTNKAVMDRKAIMLAMEALHQKGALPSPQSTVRALEQQEATLEQPPR